MAYESTQQARSTVENAPQSSPEASEDRSKDGLQSASDAVEASDSAPPPPALPCPCRPGA
jgi:hypothetical protein